RLADGNQERSPGKRLGEITPGPQHLRLFTNGWFIVCRDENDRQLVAIKGQLSVQLKAAHAGEMDVENQAVRRRRRVRFEGRFRGGECDYLVAPSPKDPLERLAHAGVVLHDKDSRHRAWHLISLDS